MRTPTAGEYCNVFFALIVVVVVGLLMNFHEENNLSSEAPAYLYRLPKESVNTVVIFQFFYEYLIRFNLQ